MPLKCIIDRPTSAEPVVVKYTSGADLLYQAWSYNLAKWYETKDPVYHQRAVGCERVLVTMGEDNK